MEKLGENVHEMSLFEYSFKVTEMFALLLTFAVGGAARMRRVRGVPTTDLARIISDYNSDRPTRASMKFMRASRVPRTVTEDSDDGTNSFIQCRPFALSRNMLKMVVNRYVEKGLRGQNKREADATKLGYAMLPKSIGNDMFGTNDDDEEMGNVDEEVYWDADDDNIDGVATYDDDDMNANRKTNEKEEMDGQTIGMDVEKAATDKAVSALVAKHLELTRPEKLRLHVRAKAKAQLCRNTFVLI